MPDLIEFMCRVVSRALRQEVKRGHTPDPQIYEFIRVTRRWLSGTAAYDDIQLARGEVCRAAWAEPGLTVRMDWVDQAANWVTRAVGATEEAARAKDEAARLKDDEWAAGLAEDESVEMAAEEEFEVNGAAWNVARVATRGDERDERGGRREHTWQLACLVRLLKSRGYE